MQNIIKPFWEVRTCIKKTVFAWFIAFRTCAKRSQQFWEARAGVRNIPNQFWSFHMHKNHSWLIYSVSRARETLSNVLRSFRAFAKRSQMFWEAFACSQNVPKCFERLSRVRKTLPNVLRTPRVSAKHSQLFWKCFAFMQTKTKF